MCKKYENCTIDNAVLMKTAQRTVQFCQNIPKISNFLRHSKLPKVKINKDWENFFAIVKFT